MSDSLAPIALFVYNRPTHSGRTLDALKACKYAHKSELYIFADGPKNEQAIERVEQTRNVIRKASGFQNIHIIERAQNMGLAANIIEGVGSLMERYGKAIVLEDDLICAASLLVYMNKALDYYQFKQDIFSICGFNYPPNQLKMPSHYQKDVYLSVRSSSWGWASWRDRWEKVDWEVKDYESFIRNRKRQKAFNKGGDDLTPMLKAQMKGRINSWAIRFCYAQFVQKAYSVYPVQSQIQNIGHDGSGTHSEDLGEMYEWDLNYREPRLSNNLYPDPEVLKAFQQVNKYTIEGTIKHYIKQAILFDRWKKWIKS